MRLPFGGVKSAPPSNFNLISSAPIVQVTSGLPRGRLKDTAQNVGSGTFLVFLVAGLGAAEVSGHKSEAASSGSFRCPAWDRTPSSWLMLRENARCQPDKPDVGLPAVPALGRFPRWPCEVRRRMYHVRVAADPLDYGIYRDVPHCGIYVATCRRIPGWGKMKFETAQGTS